MIMYLNQPFCTKGSKLEEKNDNIIPVALSIGVAKNYYAKQERN